MHPRHVRIIEHAPPRVHPEGVSASGARGKRVWRSGRNEPQMHADPRRFNRLPGGFEGACAPPRARRGAAEARSGRSQVVVHFADSSPRMAMRGLCADMKVNHHCGNGSIASAWLRVHRRFALKRRWIPAASLRSAAAWGGGWGVGRRGDASPGSCGREVAEGFARTPSLGGCVAGSSGSSTRWRLDRRARSCSLGVEHRFEQKSASVDRPRGGTTPSFRVGAALYLLSPFDPCPAPAQPRFVARPPPARRRTGGA